MNAGHDDENAYAGLLVDDAHWAFGGEFDDPLAGVDTTVPPQLDAVELARYCLMLGDDALVLGHRLSEWCSRAPDLEDDIALANIALDLIGQARVLLARAAAADPAVVPVLPPGSPVTSDDALAYFREAHQFRNARLLELPGGDFGATIARLLLAATARHATLAALTSHADPVLAALAGKGVKEVAYHRDYAARWFVTLAGGTDESRRRVLAGLAQMWRWHSEQLRTPSAVAPAPEAIEAEVDAVLAEVFAAADVPVPDPAHVAGADGRDGVHTEHLGPMLAVMQVVARAHPEGRW